MIFFPSCQCLKLHFFSYYLGLTLCRKFRRFYFIAQSVSRLKQDTTKLSRKLLGNLLVLGFELNAFTNGFQQTSQTEGLH